MEPEKTREALLSLVSQSLKESIYGQRVGHMPGCFILLRTSSWKYYAKHLEQAVADFNCCLVSFGKLMSQATGCVVGNGSQATATVSGSFGLETQMGCDHEFRILAGSCSAFFSFSFFFFEIHFEKMDLMGFAYPNIHCVTLYTFLNGCR